MKRRLVAVRSGNDGRSSSARLNDPMEKTLTEIQLKIMDSVRPLLHLKDELGCLGASRYLKRAANTALSLVGNAFADITKRRRFNVLNQTDNRYVSLLEEKDRFSVRESENLFGRHFFRPMVKTAQEGDNLMNMNRSGGHISHASNGCNRGTSGFDGRSSDRLRFNSRGGGYSAGSNNDHRLDRAAGITGFCDKQNQVVRRTVAVERIPGVVGRFSIIDAFLKEGKSGENDFDVSQTFITRRSLSVGIKLGDGKFCMGDFIYPIRPGSLQAASTPLPNRVD
ncbi:hypothetical protein OUZ56_017195 [Daphnia magna]|uniref:Uncharacterized protein n=1 Tax=Daphnia magna TaxID=35525 RepID=A0ABR0ASD4_9CRUS|nr:hypothetical protein OUZ56_017195 [Daphnia magna]